MSRGPGEFQVRVLETLALYRKLGPTLKWTWPGGARYTGASYVSANDVQRYEQGHYVHIWMLRRDLDCSAAAFSRALHGLSRLGLVYLYTGELDHCGEPYSVRTYAKFAAITPDGISWLNKRQQRNSVEVVAYERIA